MRAPLGASPTSGTQTVVMTPTEGAIFLVVTVDPGAEKAVRGLLADVSGLRRAVGFRVPEGALSCVVGIGSGLWDRLLGPPRPRQLHPLPEIAGTRYTAVATPGDLLFHLRARRLDLCFELAQRLMDRLVGQVQVLDEVHGFRSFDERDLLGFVDGTENPEGASALEAVTIGDEDPDFAGASYVVVQKYLHDLAAWEALSVAEQERAVGRTKLSDVELPDELKPSNSHLALNTVYDASGQQLQIMRYNMPFGNVGSREFGTYFIGYARSPAVIETMLSNMFIGNPVGNYDRILDFSTAVTGGLFFVPTVEFLDQVNLAPADQPGSAPGGTLPEPGGDDSLGIGGLKEVPG